MEPGLFRRLVDSMDVCIAVHDENGRLEYVNRAFAVTFGHAPEELVGRAARSLFPADRQAEFDEQIGPGRQGSSAPYETVMVAKQGERLVRVSPRSFFDEEGAYRGGFASITSIGEVRRTEVERQIMAEIARGVAVTDNLDELLRLLHDCLKRVIFAENLYVALYDAASETISFPYFVDQYDDPPPPRRRGKSSTDYVLRTGKALLMTNDLFGELVARGEIELVGSPSPSWMGVPLATADRTIGVLAVQHYEDEDAFSERDMELCASVAGHIALAIEKKRSDEALHESRQLLTSVVESMSDGVVVLDRDFQMIYFSRAMEKIARTSREKVLGSGKPAWEHFPHLLEVGVAEMMRRAMQGEEQRGEELRYWLPDGVEGFSNEIYQPLRRANGEISGVLGVVRDVTERMKAREDLQAKEEQLQHAQKMEAVGRLAGGIAHDFNNLLTAINGFADLALDDLPTESSLHGCLTEIRDAGERAATLTQKLLALSRKQVVERRPVELNSLIERFRPVLERLAGARVEIVTEPGPEPLNTELDPGQVEQVVLNLVINAIDAMPTGGRLTIGMIREELDETSALHAIVEGTYVGFEIRDSGTGMSEEVRDRVFEPFFTTKETGKGTGLGLAIVYGIVKQSDGYVWVDSEPGKGTCFRVLFPQAAEASLVARPAARAPHAPGSETVLVVEDEPGVRSLITRLLERRGYRVIGCPSASAALEVFGNPETSFDMMITDVVMPRMSGPELARRLVHVDPSLQVLFISGHLGETMESQGLIENSALLAKPFTARALLRKVRSMLDGDRDALTS
jgi:PAS domain S-box-containing protein